MEKPKDCAITTRCILPQGAIMVSALCHERTSVQELAAVCFTSLPSRNGDGASGEPVEDRGLHGDSRNPVQEVLEVRERPGRRPPSWMLDDELVADSDETIVAGISAGGLVNL